MLINPNNAAPTKGATVGGLRWSPRPGGSVISAESVNNLDSSSNSFQVMNESIIALDAAYEALDDKSSWIEAAVPISDMPVCGCASSHMSGKKLFRLVNYFRAMIGLGTIDTCPSSDNTWIDVQNNWIKTTYYPPPAFQSFLDGNPANTPVNGIIQHGSGNDNTIIKFIVADGDNHPENGSPTADFIANLGENITAEVCWFQGSGFPAGVSECRIEGE